MIYSLFNIMVIYFYETSLLLFTLNYRYTLGFTSLSSESAKILCSPLFPNNLQYFINQTFNKL